MTILVLTAVCLTGSLLGLAIVRAFRALCVAAAQFDNAGAE